MLGIDVSILTSAYARSSKKTEKVFIRFYVFPLKLRKESNIAVVWLCTCEEAPDEEISFRVNDNKYAFLQPHKSRFDNIQISFIIL